MSSVKRATRRRKARKAAPSEVRTVAQLRYARDLVQKAAAHAARKAFSAAFDATFSATILHDWPKGVGATVDLYLSTMRGELDRLSRSWHLQQAGTRGAS